MTHLLIPIEDIKGMIQSLESGIKKYEDFWSGMVTDWQKDPTYQQAQGQLALCKKLFEDPKRISLDDKDIEKKALANSRGYDAQSVALACYKQALTDLKQALNDIG